MILPPYATAFFEYHKIPFKATKFSTEEGLKYTKYIFDLALLNKRTESLLKKFLDLHK